jgi:hypothetical protein
MLETPPPKEKKKRERNENRDRKTEGKKYAPRATGDPRADSGKRWCWLRCMTTTILYRLEHLQYATATDACMPLAGDRDAGERVVPSTQTSKMMRMVQTRETSGRSPTWLSKTSKPLRVRRRIYMTNLWRWQGGLRRFQEREKENDLPWFLLVYYNIHDEGVMRILVLIKFKFVEIYLSKNRKPNTECLTVKT